MFLIPFLAWLHWDPSAEAFTIPFINRPVAWYGISFVSGFILGYFVLQPIFRQFLWKSKRLLERDIISWPKLIELLTTNTSTHKELNHKILNCLTPRQQQELKQTHDINPALKQSILDAFSALMQEAGANVDRKNLEISFPGAIARVRDLSFFFTDRLTWFIVIGTIVGARLGHVLFYDFPFYAMYPGEIIKIWEGGLASHGGTLGVIISLCIFLCFSRKTLPELSFIKLIDMLVVPTALAVTFIRIGNFVNQEILGRATSLPWGVIFGHPADRSLPEPRHPVSLYEALSYLGTFVILYYLWKYRGQTLKKGFMSGLFFVLVFGSRFLIDFLKLPQSQIIDESFLQMGQYLSLPFIVFGIILMIIPEKFFEKIPFRCQRACNH